MTAATAIRTSGNTSDSGSTETSPADAESPWTIRIFHRQPRTYHPRKSRVPLSVLGRAMEWIKLKHFLLDVTFMGYCFGPVEYVIFRALACGQTAPLVAFASARPDHGAPQTPCCSAFCS